MVSCTDTKLSSAAFRIPATISESPDSTFAIFSLISEAEFSIFADADASTVLSLSSREVSSSPIFLSEAFPTISIFAKRFSCIADTVFSNSLWTFSDLAEMFDTAVPKSLSSSRILSLSPLSSSPILSSNSRWSFSATVVVPPIFESRASFTASIFSSAPATVFPRSSSMVEIFFSKSSCTFWTRMSKTFWRLSAIPAADNAFEPISCFTPSNLFEKSSRMFSSFSSYAVCKSFTIPATLSFPLLILSFICSKSAFTSSYFPANSEEAMPIFSSNSLRIASTDFSMSSLVTANFDERESTVLPNSSFADAIFSSESFLSASTVASMSICVTATFEERLSTAFPSSP